MKYIFLILCLYSFTAYASSCNDIIKKLSTAFQNIKTAISTKQSRRGRILSEESNETKSISYNSFHDVMELIFPKIERQDPKPVSVLINYGSETLDWASIFAGSNLLGGSGHIRVTNPSGSVRGFVHFDIGSSDIDSYANLDGSKRFFDRTDVGTITGIRFYDDKGKVVDLTPSLENFAPIIINIRYVSYDNHIGIEIGSFQGKDLLSFDIAFNEQGYMTAHAKFIKREDGTKRKFDMYDKDVD